MTDPVSAKAAAAAVVSGTASVVSADLSTAMFGVPIAVILAAFAGASLALAFLPQMSRVQMLTAVLLGMAIGVYGSQLILAWQGWGAHVLPPLGFFLGLTGQLSASMLFSDGRSILVGWLKQKSGVRQGGDS